MKILILNIHALGCLDMKHCLSVNVCMYVSLCVYIVCVFRLLVGHYKRCLMSTILMLGLKWRTCLSHLHMSASACCRCTCVRCEAICCCWCASVCFMSTILMLCSMAYFLARDTASACSDDSRGSDPPRIAGSVEHFAPGPEPTNTILKSHKY